MSATNTVTVDKRAAYLLVEAVAQVEHGQNVELRFTPGYVEDVWEPGDRIESYGDSGPWAPAEVVSAGNGHVTFKYGRGGKYQITLPTYSGSIRTKHKRTIPPRVEVRVGQSEWVAL